MKRFTFFLTAFILCLSAARAQNNPVVFTFEHVVNGDPLVINETPFAIWNGKLLQITRAQFYLSQIALKKTDGTTVELADQYLLVDAANPDAEYPAGSWPVGDIQGMSMYIGVDQAHNHLDPTTYPAGHPLAPQNPTMHWGWAAGYRFMAIEGLVDDDGDGTPETVFQYHNLGDALYTLVKVSGNASLENGVLHIPVQVDYAPLFNGYAMQGALIFHGSDPQNSKMMNNAAGAGVFSITGPTSVETPAGIFVEMQVAPNPFAAQTGIRYETPFDADVEVVVSDAQGRVVYRRSGLPGTGTLTLDAQGWAAGTYHCGLYHSGRLLASRHLSTGR